MRRPRRHRGRAPHFDRTLRPQQHVPSAQHPVRTPVEIQLDKLPGHQPGSRTQILDRHRYPIHGRSPVPRNPDPEDLHLVPRPGRHRAGEGRRQGRFHQRRVVQIHHILLTARIAHHHVQIPIPIHVAQPQRHRIITSRPKVSSSHRKIARTVVQINSILPPAVARRRIQVPIPIHIAENHPLRIVSTPAQIPVPRREATRAVVQIDHILTGGFIPHRHVQISIPIHITQGDRTGIVRSGAEVPRPGSKTTRSVVQIDHILLAVVIAHRHIQIAISIHIPKAQRGVPIAGATEVPRPRRKTTRTVVQIDRILTDVVADCHVQITITIHIPQRHRFGKVAPGPEVPRTRIEIARTVVQIRHILHKLVPHGHVQITITVHIPQEQGRGRIAPRPEVLSPRREVARTVVQIRHILRIIPHGYVQIPISIHVAQRQHARLVAPRPEVPRPRRKTRRPGPGRRRESQHERLHQRQSRIALQPGRCPGRKHDLDLLTRQEIVGRIKTQRRRPGPAVRPRPHPRHRPVHHEVGRRGRAHRLAERRAHVRRLCHVDAVLPRRGRIERQNDFILPPGNFGRHLRPSHHVQIPVPIHIRRIHRHRPVEASIHDVLRPATAIPGRVLEPADIVGNARSSQHVQITIPIHVRRVHRLHPLERRIHGVERPGTPVSGRVLPPRHGIDVLGRTQHVQIPIPIHVRRIHRPRPVEGRVHRVARPRRSIPGRILPPRNSIGVFRRAQHIQIPVSIHVRRMHRPRPVETRVHGMLGPRTPIPRSVLPPGDHIGTECRAQHIQISIPVHVRRIHRCRAVERSIHTVLRPRAPIPRRVLPPGNRVGVLRSTQHVQIAIPIHIRRVHRPHRIERSIHSVLGQRAPVTRRILPPGNGIGIPRRTQQIGIPIPIHVRRIHRRRIVEATIHNLPGGKGPRRRSRSNGKLPHIRLRQSSPTSALDADGRASGKDRMHQLAGQEVIRRIERQCRSPRTAVRSGTRPCRRAAHHEVRRRRPAHRRAERRAHVRRLRHIDVVFNWRYRTDRRSRSRLVQVDRVLLALISHSQIQIAVSIHIPKGQSLGVVTPGAEIPGPRIEVTGPVVQIDRILLGVVSHPQVQIITIPVHVVQRQRTSIVAARAEIPGAGRKTARSVVQIRRILGVVIPHDRVRIAIPIHIAQQYRERVVGAGAEILDAGRKTTRPVVQIRRILSAPVCRGQIYIAIPIHIPSHGRERLIPGRTEVPGTGVEIARPIVQIDYILLTRSGYPIPGGHVQIPIPVRIEQRHCPRLIRARAEVAGAGGKAAATVVQIRRILSADIPHGHVQIPITIHITQLHPVRLIAPRAEVQTARCKGPAPVVQIRRILTAGLVPHGQIQVPISVQIPQSYRPGLVAARAEISG